MNDPRDPFYEFSKDGAGDFTPTETPRTYEIYPERPPESTIGGGGGGGGGYTAVSPFDFYLNSDDEELKFHPGTINQVIPSNIFATLALAASGTEYVVLNVNTSSGRITSANITIDSSAPGSPGILQGGPPTSFKVLLGIIVNLVGYKTIGAHSITATPVEAYRSDQATPVFGHSPYDIYYTWVIGPELA